MSGALKREPGEGFAAFKARQQEAQHDEAVRMALYRKHARWSKAGRRERRYLDALVSDQNLDPGDDYPERATP